MYVCLLPGLLHVPPSLRFLLQQHCALSPCAALARASLTRCMSLETLPSIGMIPTFRLPGSWCWSSRSRA